MKHISSVQNPLIRDLMQLQEKSRARKKEGRFLIEGRREIQLAIDGGYALETLLFTEALVQINPDDFPGAEVITITKDIYDKLAYRETTEGLIAVARTRNHELQDLKLPENPLILVAESPEKPGNIGALLRTADAAGVDAVLIADPKTDLYNPNIVRSSVGCLFTVAVATGSTEDCIRFLRDNGIAIFSATLQDATDYTGQDFTGPTAIAVGTEATGLSQPWREAATRNVLIPMRGAIDSMNVSVAAAVLVFEAVRQRF